MVTTKKVLVPFDMDKPNKVIRGLLIPGISKQGNKIFVDASTLKEWTHGMVVYIGKEITVEQFIERLNELNFPMGTGDEFRIFIENFISKIQPFKIGYKIKYQKTEQGPQLIRDTTPIPIDRPHIP